MSDLCEFVLPNFIALILANVTERVHLHSSYCFFSADKDGTLSTPRFVSTIYSFFSDFFKTLRKLPFNLYIYIRPY